MIASGVQMEAYSVEDSGNDVSFNVFVHNRTPGSKIDYLADGVAKGNKKISQWIENGTYSQTITESDMKVAGMSIWTSCATF